MSETAHKFVATAANFMQDVVEASQHRPVLVDFWAPWCGPCKSLMPLLDRLADDYGGRFALAKVNTDEQGSLATHFGIRSIPTVMLVHRGEVVDQFVGVESESFIRDMLDRHLAPPEDATAAPGEDPAPGGAVPERSPEARADDALRRRDESAATAAVDELAARNESHPQLPALRARLAFVRTANAHPDSVGLRRTLESDPSSSAARHALAAHHAVAGDYATALAEWLELMRRDRGYDDEAARRRLLQVFDVLGEQDPLVAQYRRRMASLLH
jgi:putative thioredoxin